MMTPGKIGRWAGRLLRLRPEWASGALSFDAAWVKQVLSRQCIFCSRISVILCALLPENAIWPGLGLDVVGVSYLRLTGPSDPISFLPQAVIQEGLVKAN